MKTMMTFFLCKIIIAFILLTCDVNIETYFKTQN